MDIPTELSPADIAKLRLIHAAIRLFAAKGIEGVSLRLVNREAGNKNNSALHYHFGNKQGLINATINYIQDWFESTREAKLTALELKSKSSTISVNEIIDVLINPYVTLLETETWGQDALCALARFEFDGDDEIHQILNESAGKAARRIRGLLVKALPDMPRKTINQRLNTCLFMAIQGFANIKNSHQTYMGNLQESHKAVGNQYKQFCVAGMCS
jgi:AcrR family transcriptional regulator